MRVMVLAHPQFPIPPDQLPTMIQAFSDWWGRHKGTTFEAAYFFAGGGGGFGIANVADEAALHQVMLEWPFTPFSRLEVRPLVDVETALGQWQAALQAMGGPR